MKNINQLKKEIGELQRIKENIDFSKNNPNADKQYSRCYGFLKDAKIKLETLQEVCEEIKKKIKKYDKEDWRSISFGMKEILKKFKGDEK